MNEANSYAAPAMMKAPPLKLPPWSPRNPEFWRRNLPAALVLFGVWWFVGGAISIGGSRQEAMMDGMGFAVSFLYLSFSFMGFVITGKAWLMRRNHHEHVAHREAASPTAPTESARFEELSSP